MRYKEGMGLGGGVDASVCNVDVSCRYRPLASRKERMPEEKEQEQGRY